MCVTFLVSRVCGAPLEAPTSTSDCVETIALRVLPEVVMKPKKSRGRLNFREQTSVLESVDVNKAVWIHLAEGYVLLAEKVLEKLKQRYSKSALEGRL